MVERTFAHCYETGGMRRTYLKNHSNILKRLLVHTGGFNLALAMRKMVGVGKPRRLQGSARGCFWAILAMWGEVWSAIRRQTTFVAAISRLAVTRAAA